MLLEVRGVSLGVGGKEDERWFEFLGLGVEGKGGAFLGVLDDIWFLRKVGVACVHAFVFIEMKTHLTLRTT